MGGKGSGRQKGSSSSSRWIKEILSDGKPHYGFEIYKHVKEMAKDGRYAKDPTYSSVLQMLRVLRYLGLVYKLTDEEVRSLMLNVTPALPSKGGGSIKELHERGYFKINLHRIGDKGWDNPQGTFRAEKRIY